MTNPKHTSSDLVERCKGHTPGPWSVQRRGDEVSIIGRPTWGCEYFGKKGRWPVALLDETIAEENPSEARANAHLIAAAPDLLDRIEALEAEVAELQKALLDRQDAHNTFAQGAVSEVAMLSAENERLREKIRLALLCTPQVRSGAIIYDCGDPWGILRAALEARYD